MAVCFIIELANEPLCICVPVCKPVLGRRMLCIKKMNLLDLTAWPCCCRVSGDNLCCCFLLLINMLNTVTGVMPSLTATGAAE